MTASGGASGVDAIALDRVSVHRGSVAAVVDASFTVSPGQVVALVGPNGAGKTTVLETIQGYLSPSSGSVEVFGQSPVDNRAALAQRWGVMPQQGGLPMGLTVSEAVSLFRTLHGSTADVGELLDLAGLTALAGRRWRRLSGGEQQRLSLAIALCGGSDLLLLDEPTAAVDPDGRERILSLVEARAASGSAVLITTHRFDDVERIASHVVMMDRGRVVAYEGLASLTADRTSIRFQGPAGLDVTALAAILGPAEEVTPGHFDVTVAPEPANVATLVNWLTDQGIAPEGLQAGRTSLEARFHELTGHSFETADDS